MSLLERKRENDRKAAEEEARLAEEKKLQDLAVHPLVKDGAGRDIRDAYFSAIAFAAFADDDKLDKGERVILADIGESLGIAASEIEETLQSIQNLSDDDKFVFIEESVRAISGNELGVKLFYAQFVQIWASHEYSRNELFEYLKRFSEWTGVVAPSDNQLRSILNVLKGGDDIDSDLDSLAKWMGDAALKHFVVKQHGDVADRLSALRKRIKAEEDRKRREKELIAEKKRQQGLLAQAMKDVVDTYSDRASVSVDAFEFISDKVKAIDADLIDWPLEVNAILHPNDVQRPDINMDKILQLFGSSSSYTHKCRVKVWRLVTLLMLDKKPKRSDMCTELDWLLSSKGIGAKSWDERFRSFIERYLKNRVVFE